jgi:hypothetical protein
VPKRRAPDQTGGITNSGTINTDGGVVVGRDKITHHHGLSEERLLALLVKSQQGLLEDAQKAGLQTPTIVALARRLKPDVLDPEHALVLGEGFACRQAYENRPSTNPRGCGDGIWVFRVLRG